jgi:5'-methylthioadenosine phosphorylase
VEKAKVAIIARAGLETLLEGAIQTRIGTPYGPSPIITIGKVGRKDVAFLPRQDEGQDTPPHKVNYRANIWALHILGVERILATDFVRGINPHLAVGGFVVPHDIIDLTKHRITTFYDEAPVIQVDGANPYCPDLRKFLLSATRKVAKKVLSEAVYVCTEGPRYETLAEIRMYHKLGCDIVGMTGVPEPFLARELGICYATICSVINLAAGRRRRLSAEEVSRVTMKAMEKLQQILKSTIQKMPERGRCHCLKVLATARI